MLRNIMPWQGVLTMMMRLLMKKMMKKWLHIWRANRPLDCQAPFWSKTPCLPCLPCLLIPHLNISIVRYYQNLSNWKSRSEIYISGLNNPNNWIFEQYRAMLKLLRPIPCIVDELKMFSISPICEKVFTTWPPSGHQVVTKWSPIRYQVVTK